MTARPSHRRKLTNCESGGNNAIPEGVLYIEDNAVNMILVEQLLLIGRGVTGVKAETGREGIALARSAGHAVKLLDMRLPRYERR